MKFKICAFFILIFFLDACNSSPKTLNEEKLHEYNQSLANVKERLSKLEGQNEILQLKVVDVEIDNSITKKMSGINKNEIDSLREQLRTNNKNVDILKRGIKSGLFEDFNSEKSQNKTMLPDLSRGRGETVEVLGFESQISDSEKPEINPDSLLEKAERQLTSMKFNEAIESIQALRKNFPNFKDEGRSFLISSESWLKLNTFENVFPELAQFYAKYPKSQELMKAKTIEGQAFEQMGSGRKAVQVYAEIVALAPQSSYAQYARNAIERIRNNEY